MIGAAAGVRSTVDIRPAIEDAHREAAVRGGAYGETMATYAELGDLLESGRSDEAYVAECCDLVDRLVELDRVPRQEMEARHVLWATRHLVGGAGVE